MRVAIDGVYFGSARKLGAEVLIALAREVGADGLNWPFSDGYGAEDPEPVAAQLSAAGLAVVSLGLTAHTSAVPGKEAEFREMFGRAARAARHFGTRIIDGWPMRPKEVSKEDAQRTLRSNLEAVAPVAAAAGCALSLEFEPDTTIERYAEGKALIEPFAPAALLTADTYHIIRVGDDLAQAAASLGTTIGVVHFSGSHRKECGSEGDGCDYAAFLAAALQAGYDGDIVLQYAPPEDAAASLKRAVALTRKVIAETA